MLAWQGHSAKEHVTLWRLGLGESIPDVTLAAAFVANDTLPLFLSHRPHVFCQGVSGEQATFGVS